MDREETQKRIREYFDSREEDMVRDIFRLMRIDSLKSEPLPGMPFGEKCAKVLEEAEKIARALGFPVTNYDNYAVAIDLNDKPSRLDLLAHLDVVPAAGQVWEATEPFAPVLKEGIISGRGSADDKGPAMAALYAMAAVRDLGVPLGYNVRLILGADEESGSSDIAYYYKKEQPAAMTFSPDSDFPVINCEKGGYWSGFSGTFPAEEHPVLAEFHGGDRGNAVPAQGWMRLQGVDADQVTALCRRIDKDTGVWFQVSRDGKDCVVRAAGTGAHASVPETGNNGVTALLRVLRSLGVKGEGGTKAVMALAKMFPHGEFYGESAGVAMEDKKCGKLTLGLNVLHFDGVKVEGRIDCRTPLCATDENVAQVLRRKFEAAGLLLGEEHICPAHYVPEDSPFVQTLLRCYEQYTGKKGYCISTGGMTYTHHVENGVAFGCAFPGQDNRMHGADEWVSLADLKLSGSIFAQVMAEICAEESPVTVQIGLRVYRADRAKA